MEPGDAGRASATGRRRAWYLLLVLPFLGTLFPQLYNSISPTLAGLPFFYWYQLLWVIIGAVLVGGVYLLTR